MKTALQDNDLGMCPGFDEWQLKFESDFVTLKQFTAGTTVVRMKSSNP